MSSRARTSFPFRNAGLGVSLLASLVLAACHGDTAEPTNPANPSNSTRTPTTPVTSPTGATAPGVIHLASAVGVDSTTGASITTDKDDYVPGDSVRVVGAGWGADEAVHFRLTREPDVAGIGMVEWETHADEQGAFTTGFEVVATDLGTLFTLTASGATSGSSASALFTDGTISNGSIAMREATCTNALSGSVTTGTTLCAFASFTIAGTGATASQFRWKSPAGVIVEIAQNTAFGNGVTGSRNAQDTFIPNAAGTWTVLLCEGENANTAPAGVAGCQSGQQRATQTFSVIAAPTSQPTSTSVVGTPNPSFGGQAVTFTATVTSNGSPVTTGTVDFRLGSTNCTDGTAFATGAALDASGHATANRAFSVAESGSTIRACYSGAANLDPSNGSTTHTVNTNAASQVSVAGSPNPSLSGQSVTFTAAVTSGGSAVTTGTVDFRLGGTDCTDGVAFATGASLNGSGQASASRVFAAAESGSTIRACYSGALGVNPSSGTTTQTVNRIPTQTTLTGSPNPSVTGQSVTFTATVTSGGSPVTTGMVDFRVGSTSCADGTTFGSPASLSASGQATASRGFNASDSPASIRACYSGTATLDVSSGTVVQTINKASTLVTLTDTPDPSTFGQSVALSASVTVVAPGAGTPTGTVSFYDGGTCAAPGNLVGSDATAPWSTSVDDLSVSGSPYTLLACYSGSANFLPNGDTEPHTVNPAPTSTSLSVTPSSQQYSDKTVLHAAVTPFQLPAGSPTQQLTGTMYFYAGASAVSCGMAAPAGSIGSDAIADADDGVAELTYAIDKQPGAYVVTACFYSSNANFTGSDASSSLGVSAENATIFDFGSAPAQVLVGSSASLTFKLRETNPELNFDQALAAAGNIDLATITLALKGVLNGGTTNVTCSSVGSGTGYDRVRTFTCITPTSLAADTYEATATAGGYYTGEDAIVVQITDPSAGFATGGGWYWFGGDRVNFGFMAKATVVNSKKVNYQGALLVIRHRPDGTVIKVKSNVFEGYSVQGTEVTFSGKANYSTNGVTDGNYAFTGYGNDLGTSGGGVDKFGLYYTRPGNLVATSATILGLPASAVTLEGGNIQTPQPGRK